MTSLDLFTDMPTARAPIITERDARIVGEHRYTLTRIWAGWERVVLFVMLNPSTADAETDDRTVKLCVKLAFEWGYTGLIIENLFAFRSTDPAGLRTAADPIGPENDDALRRSITRAALRVAAWGAPPSPPRGKRAGHPIVGRAESILSMLVEAGDVHCLVVTSAGNPHHPLRIHERDLAGAPRLFRSAA